MMICETTVRTTESGTQTARVAIGRQIEESVSYHAGAGPEAIERRLKELDGEWDIDRAFGTSAAGIVLFSVVLGVVENRKWFLVPAVVAATFLQYALQGWSPPLPWLRQLGFRTGAEINRERYALKALRGDFQGVEPAADEHVQQKAAAALRAVDR